MAVSSGDRGEKKGHTHHGEKAPCFFSLPFPCFTLWRRSPATSEISMELKKHFSRVRIEELFSRVRIQELILMVV